MKIPKWYVECSGSCIKPNQDIIQRFFKTEKECIKFVNNCSRKKKGYVCDVLISLNVNL